MTVISRPSYHWQSRACSPGMRRPINKRSHLIGNQHAIWLWNCFVDIRYQWVLQITETAWLSVCLNPRKVWKLQKMKKIWIQIGILQTKMQICVSKKTAVDQFIWSETTYHTVNGNAQYFCVYGLKLVIAVTESSNLCNKRWKWNTETKPLLTIQ